ncbi:PhnD/SsuA/transferrin family substrate-binding protein [Phaeobacter gallaeciensis]|uniref:ABC-type phosphate/phosphonate transport system, periplasmic component n=4 Tax=Phaeobacter gallaeciensis TaxID=60890 RepID=A0AAC9ZD32_9RHOB|nr:PhnD/SsuA/transferrin family substrate-binding protein [Phaeobacter gallaeciensis]AHD11654.1 ABC-type phosphate/phosphonate transport system, periplasmic component [Phaeobacter gallaeciensis DSM 26640]ATE94918.1 ABC-type phosphate/phosphonate transport system, periplasmic component [Phaeobacter gallaeciensis]ATE99189.1 ABC-type phosphate/phosphonate transport system, periplasmic component [Phaeobacter gallaeciensis]ATF03582.1 ABC-type phosphate/phosphonate transport system, periplasmic compo
MRGFTEPAASGFRLEKMMPTAWKYHCGPKGVMRLWSMICVCLLMVLAPMAARADITLTFGTYAADKPTVTVKKYRPFLTFLSNRLGEALGEKVVIRMTVAKEYQEGIDQLASGEVDFARFGPASYVHVMKQNPGIQIVAMESKKGRKRFKGVIVVHRDSAITELSDLAGLSFAFGDELSTIGRYLAQSHLLEAGIDSGDLHTYDYLGRHDLVGEAVGAGKFTAGALKESTYKKLIAKGVPIRVLASFDNVTKPWLASSTLPENVLLAMREIMLSSENEEIVRRVSKNGFLQGSDSDYDLIRDAMEQSQAF